MRISVTSEVLALGRKRKNGGADGGDKVINKARQALQDKGCQVLITNRQQEMLDYIAGLVGPGNGAVMAGFDLARELNIKEGLQQRGVAVQDTPGCGKDAILAARVGITGIDAVVTETGTLLLVENDGDSRMASNMPPVHVAVVGADAVVKELADGWARVRAVSRARYNVPLARYVTAISGPSRTADIELKMALGMHGPGEVHVILWQS